MSKALMSAGMVGKVLWVWCVLTAVSLAAEPNTRKLNVPQGYHIEILVSGVDNARQMVMGNNTLFIGTRSEGAVYAVHDPLGQPRVQVIAKDLSMPSGIAMQNGDLYVGAVDKILRFPDIERQLQGGGLPAAPDVVFSGLPDDKHHGWKNIGFGPDGLLYIPIGAPCNICEPGAPYASIQALDISTGKLTPVAEGVRNSVGFDWHPVTGHLWFTDNGRDWLGDEFPPEEVNVVRKFGQHFGYPYLHGRDIQDPEFYSRKPVDLEITPPYLAMTAHAAPLGIKFYTGNQFPFQKGRQVVFVAQHGSWNRSEKSGYRVMEIVLDDSGRVVDFRPFVSGWLDAEGNVSGRPVAFLQLDDGSLLISDDLAGVVYRLTYRGS